MCGTAVVEAWGLLKRWVALAALRSLCTEGCVRTARSTCVGVRNVIREFIWTAAALLCTQIRTGFFTSTVCHIHTCVCACMHTHN